jgi:hypothetical protein
VGVLFRSGVGEERKLGGLVNRVLERTLDLKEKEMKWERLHSKALMFCTCR